MRTPWHHIAIVIALFVTASPATATEVSLNTRITRLMPLSTGQIVVSIQDDALGCQNPNVPKRYLLSTSGSMTADGVKNIYAALLYASAAEKTVTFWFDDASTNCSITRIWVIN